MGKNIRVNRSPTPKLNELIKLAIGNRSLRQVEEESGISLDYSERFDRMAFCLSLNEPQFRWLTTPEFGLFC